MFNKPIFFERNRVGRVYLGGKLFGDFFGDEPVDGFEPEEWIASNVKAINKIEKSPKEGISKVKDSDVYFDDLLKMYPEEMLGSAVNFKVLVKGLDSAIRLPAQAHPDKAFSRKYFNSNFGKTECWVILATRPDAKIFFGFKDGVTKSQFLKAIDESENDAFAMENLMKSIEPKVGDVLLVPAKTVHAIGQGCLILEIQEPTDFTIQPEHYCGDYKLSYNEMYLGLSKEVAVECFEFCQAPDAEIEPEIIISEDNLIVESLINEKHTDCFVINRISLNGGTFAANINDSYAIYIVTEGEAEIFGDGYSRQIKKGDYFFMPAASMGRFKISGNAKIIECY